MPCTYCARTAQPETSSRGMGRTARSTLSFSSRTASAPKATGGSMATSEKSWMRCGVIMSRSAPASS